MQPQPRLCPFCRRRRNKGKETCGAARCLHKLALQKAGIETVKILLWTARQATAVKYMAATGLAQQAEATVWGAPRPGFICGEWFYFEVAGKKNSGRNQRWLTENKTQGAVYDRRKNKH